MIHLQPCEFAFIPGLGCTETAAGCTAFGAPPLREPGRGGGGGAAGPDIEGFTSWPSVELGIPFTTEPWDVLTSML